MGRSRIVRVGDETLAKRSDALKVEGKGGEEDRECDGKTWNQLPLAVRQCTTVNHFKVALKTHLFTAYYFDSL